MFLYKFYCKSCDKYTEDFAEMGTDIHPCEFCGGNATRSISVPSLVFKGDGWIDKKIKKEREQRRNNERKS